MNLTRRRFLNGLLATPFMPSALARQPGLRFRVVPEGWGAAQPREVEAVLRSASSLLTPWFPRLQPEPFVVMFNKDGPIVHYKRNALGEIVMMLSARDHFWCRYAYQFCHELTHILCGFQDIPYKNNLWFEETLCTTASLFVLRRLTPHWTTTPPFPDWQPYAPEFARYASGIITRHAFPSESNLREFFQKNRTHLQLTPRDRPLNTTMAVALLDAFEHSPESWESITWLNSHPPRQEISLETHLAIWRNAAPPRHRPFISEIQRRFGAG